MVLFSTSIMPSLRMQLHDVKLTLPAGTTVTITLKGNRTRKEAQYKAKLKSYYADTDDSKTRDIEATVSVIFAMIKCRDETTNTKRMVKCINHCSCRFY